MKACALQLAPNAMPQDTNHAPRDANGKAMGLMRMLMAQISNAATLLQTTRLEFMIIR